MLPEYVQRRDAKEDWFFNKGVIGSNKFLDNNQLAMKHIHI